MIFKRTSFFSTVIVALFFNSTGLCADEFNKRAIDSLRLVLKRSANDSLKLKAMTELAFAIKYNQRKERDSLSQCAIKLGL